MSTETPEAGGAIVSAIAAATPFTKFSAELNTQYDAAASKTLGYDVWRVTKAFKYYVGDIADDCWVYVPAGYLTDGASVPQLLWNLLPPWGAYGQAAVVHDILCETLIVHKGGQAQQITRAKADSIFKEAMTVLGVPAWKRNVMYIAVRTFATVTNRVNPSDDPKKDELQNAWQPT
jgi:hypothetical protein